MSYIREIWFPNREQSTVFKAVFVLCLYATHSVIFVNNPKLVHRRQPYPNSVAVFSLRHSRTINRRIKGKPGIILHTGVHVFYKFVLRDFAYRILLNAVHPDVLFDSQGIRIIQSNTSFLLLF